MAVNWGLIKDMPADIAGSFQQGQKNALVMQQAGQEQAVNALKMQKYQTEAKNENALTKAFQESGGDMSKAKSALMTAGQYKPAMEISKLEADQRKSELEAKKTELETHVNKMEVLGRIFSTSHDQASHEQNLQEAASMFGEDSITNVPKVYNPTELGFVLKKAESIKDQKYNEIQRHNQELRQQEIEAMGGYRQQMLAQGEERLSQGERQLGMQEQAALAKSMEPAKLENIPPAHRAAYMENEAALNKIDAAIEKIKANPDALGMGNVAGEFVTQRTDPQGVATRAALAEISSQKRHELSGASITASESPVLAPFIPKSTDDPTAAIEKLNSLKKHYLESNSQFEGEYSKTDYKNPFPTKAQERKEKIAIIDELEKAQKEGGITFGAKGGAKMDLEKQPLEDLRKLRDEIKGGKGNEPAQEEITHPQYPGFSIRK